MKVMRIKRRACFFCSDKHCLPLMMYQGVLPHVMWLIASVVLFVAFATFAAVGPLYFAPVSQSAYASSASQDGPVGEEGGDEAIVVDEDDTAYSAVNPAETQTQQQATLPINIDGLLYVLIGLFFFLVGFSWRAVAFARSVRAVSKRIVR